LQSAGLHPMILSSVVKAPSSVATVNILFLKFLSPSKKTKVSACANKREDHCLEKGDHAGFHPAIRKQIDETTPEQQKSDLHRPQCLQVIVA